jgi:hypothetical protein
VSDEPTVDFHDPSGAKGNGASRAAPASSSGESVTTRHWDGWPTPPTPGYLVPEMDKIPVSSTVHFQTVAITGLGDGVDADELWRKLRAPMLKTLRKRPENNEGRLVITDAVFGDTTPSETVDVTEQVAEMVEGGTLSLRPTKALFGEPVPGLPQSLVLRYRIVGLSDAILGAVAAEGEELRLPRDLEVTGARYGSLSEDAVMDVTAAVQQRVQGNTLSIAVSNDTFGRDPHPNHKKQLEVDYTIGRYSGQLVMDEGETLRLPQGLQIEGANYGFAGNGLNVTRTLTERIEGRRLHAVASVEAMGTDPAPGRPKSLRVDYTIDGVPHSVTVQENQTVDLEAPELYTPDGIFKAYFDPPPAAVAELADRLVAGGFKPMDFAPDDVELASDDVDFIPDAEFATMREVLEGMMGIARHDRLDPLEHGQTDAVDMPAEGVILYHEQGWYGRGLALGNLLHSVALAPGEVTQVAMTHWNHRTRSTDSEAVSQTDRQTETGMQDRAVSEIQSSSLHENASGDSAAGSDSVSTGFGSSSTKAKASWRPFSGVQGSVTGTSSSVGTSHTVSSAVTHSSGDKNLSMGSNQSINALTRQHAEAARTRRATVVREVAQSEDETLTTRVVANYNHMHALTVMYFEVIEVFSLKTRVVDAERLIFLPFKVRDVRDLVPRYRPTLIDAANAAGQFAMAEAIRHYQNGKDEIALLDERIAEIKGTGDSDIAETKGTGDSDEDITKKGSLGIAEARLRQLKQALEDNASDFESERESFGVKLGKLRGDREAALKAFADLSNLPSFIGEAVRQAMQAQLKPIEEQAAKVQGRLDALHAAERRRYWELIAQRDETMQLIDRLKRRQRDLEEAKRLLENLSEAETRGPFHDNRLYFNQALWLSLSPGEVLGLARRLNEFKGEALYGSIDPTPVAITGNHVGYRWRIRDALASERFKKQFVEPFIGDPERELATVSADIAVPTGGVFGEAVLGNGVSAEKIDLSRFWNWKDSMIPILPTKINPLNAATPTMQDLSPEPGQLDESSAKLSPLQDLPAPAGFGALAQTMQTQVFRDMTGQSLLQTLADATTNAAASSESNAAQIASKNLQAGLDFMSEMASKALSVAAAPETGGASLLGGMVSSKNGGGASLLGGVLNADDAGGKLFTKMAGSKGKLSDALEESVLGGLANAGRSGERPSSGGGSDTREGGTPADGGGSGETGETGEDLPPDERELKPPVPGQD